MNCTSNKECDHKLYLISFYITMILSIDIGIKNLSLCCMDYTDHKDLSSYIIKLWDVYDTLDTEDYFCQSLKRDGKPCGKRCGYKFNKQLKKFTEYVLNTYGV